MSENERPEDLDENFDDDFAPSEEAAYDDTDDTPGTEEVPVDVEPLDAQDEDFESPHDEWETSAPIDDADMPDADYDLPAYDENPDSDASFDDSEAPSSYEPEEPSFDDFADDVSLNDADSQAEDHLSEEAAYAGFSTGEDEDEDSFTADNEFPEESEADEAPPAPSLQPMRVTDRPEVDVVPLPAPGPYEQPAMLTVYKDHEVLGQFEILDDKTLFGASADVEEGIFDLSGAQVEGIAHKHVAIFRQNKNYTLYALADAHTQLNDDLIGLGGRAALKDGDVIVLGQELALRFTTPV